MSGKERVRRRRSNSRRFFRWAAENVDPALFSKEFMAHAAAAVGTEDVSVGFLFSSSLLAG